MRCALVSKIPLVVTMMALAGLAPAVAVESEPFPLAFVTDGPYALQIEHADIVAKMPVDLQAVDGYDLDEVRLVVAYVTHGESDSHELTAATEARLERSDEEGMPWVLEIRIGLEPLARRHGSYEVGLRARALSRSKNQNGEPQAEWGPWIDKQVTLVRPAATLTVPPKVQLWETRLGSFMYSRSNGLFWIESDHPWSDASVRPEPARISGRVAPGRIEAKPSSNSKDPRALSYEASITESFPLGVATGEMLVESPDTSRVRLPYEVDTRQHWILIPLLALAGIGLGYLTRVVLAIRIQRSRALLQLGDLERHVRQLMIRIEDAVLRREAQSQLDKIAAVAAKVRRALKPETVTEIVTEIQGIQTAVDQLLQKTDARRLEIEQNLTVTLDTINTAWKLPAPLIAVVEQTRTKLRNTTEQLREYRLDTAAETMNRACETGASDLDGAWQSWHRSVDQGLKGLLEVSPPLPKPVRDESDGRLATVTQALDGVTIDPRLAPIARLTIVANGAHAARGMAVRWIEQLLDSTARISAMTADVLRGATTLPDENAVEELVTASETLLRQDARAVVDDPEQGLEALETLLAETTSLTKRAILGQLATSDAQKPLAKDLEQGAYVAAAQLAVQALAAATPRDATMLSGGQTAVPPPTPIRYDSAFGPLEVVPPERATVMLASRSIPQAPPMIIDQVRNRRVLARAVGLQTIVVGVLFAVLAVTLNAHDFVGHLDDCVQIFFWGFTVDVGMNSLIEAVKAT